MKINDEMTGELKASVWRALLDSCRIHFIMIIGKRVAKHVLAKIHTFVTNPYSASERWHCSDMVREMPEKRGFGKSCWKLDYSSEEGTFILCKGQVTSLDQGHISSGLQTLVLECLKAGYIPDTSIVPHEVEEYQKKDFLLYHSAKQPTCGLLMTKPGEPIRITKNILQCRDCHTFFEICFYCHQEKFFLGMLLDFIASRMDSAPVKVFGD